MGLMKTFTTHIAENQINFPHLVLQDLQMDKCSVLNLVGDGSTLCWSIIIRKEMTLIGCTHRFQLDVKEIMEDKEAHVSQMNQLWIS